MSRRTGRWIMLLSFVISAGVSFSADGFIEIGANEMEPMMMPQDERPLLNPGWEAQRSGIDASLRGVCANSKTVAWASGSSGTVLKTSNGGGTWISVSVPGAENLDFRDVHAFDADTALVMSAGRPAKIYKTTDGGKAWLECYSNDREGVFLNSLAFWDHARGLAVGDPLGGYFLVLRTLDGGESWSRVPAEEIPSPREGEAEFAASGTCVAVAGEGLAWFVTGGKAASVFRSEDWGCSWTAAEAPILNGEPSQGIFSVAFIDGEKGIIVGGDYRDPDRRERNAAYSSDGGKTWLPVTEAGLPHGFRSCAAYVQGLGGPTLVAVGVSGSDYSPDGGRSWIAFSETGFHAASFATDGAGWAVGSEGRIARFVRDKKVVR